MNSTIKTQNRNGNENMSNIKEGETITREGKSEEKDNETNDIISSKKGKRKREDDEPISLGDQDDDEFKMV